jgi:hypothetical protein
VSPPTTDIGFSNGQPIARHASFGMQGKQE